VQALSHLDKEEREHLLKIWQEKRTALTMAA